MGGLKSRKLCVVIKLCGTFYVFTDLVCTVQYQANKESQRISIYDHLHVIVTPLQTFIIASFGKFVQTDIVDNLGVSVNGI